MKKLLTILILISVLLLSCKTKTVTSTKEKESETKEYFSKKDESKNESSKNLQNQEKKIDSVTKSEENEDEFEIAGKVEIDKPFEIQRIENGDTLETFKIIGNADFRFKTKKKTSSGNKNFSETKSSESKQQNASGNSVNTQSKSKVENIKKAKNKEVITKNFTFGAWTSGVLILIVIIIAIWLFIYFKKYRK